MTRATINDYATARSALGARGKLNAMIARTKNEYRDVAQLVARLLWEQDVAGSNPVIPTKKVVSSDTTFFAFIGEMI